jgi:hypothetical protein
MPVEFIPNQELRLYTIFPTEGRKIAFRNPDTREAIILDPPEALDLILRSYTNPDTGRVMIDREEAISVMLLSFFSGLTRMGISPDSKEFYDLYPKVKPKIDALAEIAMADSDSQLDFEEVLEKHLVAFK